MLPAMVDGGAVFLDPGVIYPEVAELRAALVARDWARSRAVLDPATPAGRTELIRMAAELPDLAGHLGEVLRADPADTVAAVLLGSHLTEVAWRVRSRARARHVSREQFAKFHDILRQAEQVLIDAAARNPAEPAAWVCRLPTARGLELGQPEVRRRYDRLAALDPHHLPGQLQLLQQLCPKWGGSWERMHGFAREAADAAPAGSPNAVLIAEAHIEHSMEEATLDASRAYLRPYVGELREAAQRSVWHSGFRRDIGWVRVAGTFAMAFGLGGDPRSAGSMFAMLGEFGSERPWDYLGDPASAIRAHRSAALRATGAQR
jgi:hypothetical protein